MAALERAAAGLPAAVRVGLLVSSQQTNAEEPPLKRWRECSDDAHVDAHPDEQQQFTSWADALTGLPDRHCFEARLAAEGARLRRHGGEASVCLIDLEGFKQVNATLGHPAGDCVLRAVAKHLGELRGEDSAYRIGGDEFALILVAAGEEGAAVAALRLADAMRTDPACHGVGVSFGVAHIDAEHPEGAIARAGAAMYDAKRASSS
jgi:diguanylate cyclase (GGDEF)-like protein